MLTIRPIRPEDAAAHADFFKRLTPEDIRYRFFSALRELSAEQMSPLHIDYERDMATRPGPNGCRVTLPANDLDRRRVFHRKPAINIRPFASRTAIAAAVGAVDVAPGGDRPPRENHDWLR